VQEGLFLYTHNLSPYDGGVFYQASLNLTKLRARLTDIAAGAASAAVVRPHTVFSLLPLYKRAIYCPGPPLRPFPHTDS